MACGNSLLACVLGFGFFSCCSRVCGAPKGHKKDGWWRALHFPPASLRFICWLGPPEVASGSLETTRKMQLLKGKYSDAWQLHAVPGSFWCLKVPLTQASPFLVLCLCSFSVGDWKRESALLPNKRLETNLRAYFLSCSSPLPNASSGKQHVHSPRGFGVPCSCSEQYVLEVDSFGWGHWQYHEASLFSSSWGFLMFICGCFSALLVLRLTRNPIVTAIQWMLFFTPPPLKLRAQLTRRSHIWPALVGRVLLGSGVPAT